MRCNKDQRDRALDRAEAVGYAAAAAELGLNVNTLRSWASRHGRKITTTPTSVTAAATEAKIASTAARKATLAQGLLDDVERLRHDLFAPTVERRAVVVSGGAGRPSDVEVVEIRHPTTTPTERKATMTAIAIAIDKTLLLLGEATERIESLTTVTDTTERRQLAVGAVDELAQRRAS